MDEKEIKRIAQQEIKDYMDSKQFTFSRIPAHAHAGPDAPRVEEKNLVRTQKYSSGLTFFDEAFGSNTQTVTITNFPKFNSLHFFGFAANNANGSAATKRVLSQGIVKTGICSALFVDGTLKGNFTAPLQVESLETDFIQMSNGTYIDSASLANNRVSITNLAIFYATDNTGAPVAYISVDSIQDNQLTITGYTATNWKIQGNFVLD